MNNLKWMVLAGLLSSAVPQALAQQIKILVYTKNGTGYVHDNIEKSSTTIRDLGEQNGLDVTISNDPAVMTDDNLKLYRVVVFCNSNNDGFDNDTQRLAFQRYIEAGGGFVGIHSACGSERKWPWFWQMLGGTFKRHPPLQPFDLVSVDPRHPTTDFLPAVWHWEDECYYLTNLNPDIHVLLAADLNTVSDDKKDEYPGEVFGHYFPNTWCHEFDGGREWYTALGHKKEYYDDPGFQQLILRGIQWAAGGNGKLDYSRATTQLIAEKTKHE